ncbi:MAG: hypothetical protein U0667_06425 [Chloroflexota bacterium]
MTTSAGGRVRAASHPRITLARLPVACLALILAAGATAVAAEPSASPSPAVLGLTATGPFGTVGGEQAPAPPDPASLPVLDGWARGASVLIRATDGTLSPWRAMALAEPDLDPAQATDLGTGEGDASLVLSDTGMFLLRVDATVRPDGDAVEGTWWWRVAVPDRERPEDEYGPPVPAIGLASGDDTQTLEQGSSCYVGTCGDIGRVSPPDLLPTVRTTEGAPLEVSLADGSGMASWSVSATPVGGADSDAVVLGRSDRATTTRAWVLSPAEGDWVVTVSVEFDRERGSADGYGRLVVGPAADG